MFHWFFQVEEESYLQKAEKLYSLMNAVTDKVRGRGFSSALLLFKEGQEVMSEADSCMHVAPSS